MCWLVYLFNSEIRSYVEASNNLSYSFNSSTFSPTTIPNPADPCATQTLDDPQMQRKHRRLLLLFFFDILSTTETIARSRSDFRAEYKEGARCHTISSTYRTSSRAHIKNTHPLARYNTVILVPIARRVAPSSLCSFFDRMSIYHVARF